MELTADMQRQAKAIADGSRFQIFEYICSADEPVRVSELTDLLGFNHNAIRQHLTVLVEASLIVEGDEKRTTRGRPRKQYTPRADTLSAFRSVAGSYDRLAALLLEIVSSGRESFDVGFEAGERDARILQQVSGSHEQSVDILALGLARDGFEPAIDVDGAIELLNCPFADLAVENPGVICELHRGLISGQLSVVDGAARADLQPRDARAAGCLVSLVEGADS